MHEVLPTVEVMAAREVSALLPPSDDADLMQATKALLCTKVVSDYEDGPHTVGSVLSAAESDALLVLHRGQVVAEEYWHGDRDTLRLTQSISKSITCCLAAAVLEPNPDMWQRSLSSLIGDALPAHAALATATAEQLADMSASLAFDESYHDFATGTGAAAEVVVAGSGNGDDDANGGHNTGDDIAALNRAAGWHPPLGSSPTSVGAPSDEGHGSSSSTSGLLPPVYAFLAGLRASPYGEAHGDGFTYRSCNTEALQWALEALAPRGGGPLPDLTSSVLWERLGCEGRALWTRADAHGRRTMASGGLCCCARDLARWGQMLLRGGLAASGRRVLPEAWVRSILTGAGAKADRFQRSGVQPFFSSYQNGFWIVGDCHDAHGRTVAPTAFCARGIHGQLVLVDTKHELVVVLLGTSEHPDDCDCLYRAFEALEHITARVTGQSVAKCRYHVGDCVGYRTWQ